VFGPHPKGNLARLMRLCASGLPLPFGAVRNRRGMVGVTNLSDALLFLARAEASRVAGRVFHVAETEPYGLAALVAACRAAMGRPPRLFSVPPPLLSFGLRAVGRGAMAEQLLGDLLVDGSQLRDAGWKPRDTAAGDLRAMARSAA
jgi:UDP-glucose 4-epimerase